MDRGNKIRSDNIVDYINEMDSQITDLQDEKSKQEIIIESLTSANESLHETIKELSNQIERYQETETWHLDRIRDLKYEVERLESKVC